MKLPSLRLSGRHSRIFWGKIFAACLLLAPTILLRGEGSKDFIGYPGYRLFLDTRDTQQLKVFAKVGEYINVGASHLNIDGGFIRVYAPDGTLKAVFDGTGATAAQGTIYNNVQEAAGPTGGGTTNGTGYVPGVVQVQPGEEGVWTVYMSFPNYVPVDFPNLLNSDAWTRNANQPQFPRVILAWDITVSTSAAGNMGGILKTGRVYTNEYISIINQNGYTTSPVFYVLTKSGFLYKVNFHNADPFRFPINSNSTGLLSHDLQPMYSSQERDMIIRSANPANWLPGNYYLYEPQAQDYNGLVVNNKIFFSQPDPNLPATGKTTDIFRNNSHVTWLFSAPQTMAVTIQNISLLAYSAGGDPCVSGSLEAGQGGVFQFESSAGGTVVLRLDLNGDGDYDDATDRTIFQQIQPGQNTVAWDGKNGLGTALAPTQDFSVRYQITVRGGETHIMLSDVENNAGGVTFSLLSNLQIANPDEFYYDHTPVGGTVSGGGTPGNPLPTTQPFTYSNGFGNNKMLDYWAFINLSGGANGTILVDIVSDCSPIPAHDNDNDGIADKLDIDDDNDGVPDRKEFCNNNGGGFDCLPGGLDPSADTDNDGIANYLDANDLAVQNPCADANDNGICDQVIAIFDHDGDYVPDHFDLDSDNDGITDLTEAGHAQPDQNGDGVIDGLPAAFGQNGLFISISSSISSPNAVETYIRWDWDDDDIPDHDDLDADNDGINDVAEAGFGQNDLNNDGKIEGGASANGLAQVLDPALTGHGISLPPDTDFDTKPDWHDLDSDDDGIPDVTETNKPDPDFNSIIGVGNPAVNAFGQATASQPTSNPTNTDGDAKPDFQEWDSDDDGILDPEECPFNAPCADGDSDQTPDFQDIDRDNDGISDEYECETGMPCADTDLDGYFDVDDLDTDGDGLTDAAECSGGEPCPDANGNGIPEWREFNCNANTASPQISAVNGGGDICEGASVLLTAFNFTDVEGDVIGYTWTGPNGFTFSGLAPENGPFAVSISNVTDFNTGTYTLQLYTQSGCPSLPKAIQLVVHEAPQPPQLDASANQFCMGETLQLNSTAYGGSNVSYQWFFQNGSGTAFLGLTSIPTFFVQNLNAANTGIYTVQVSANGCASPVSNAESISVTSQLAVVPTLEAEADLLCVGQNLELNSTAFAGQNVVYQWWFNGGNGFAPLGVSSSPTWFIPNATTSNSGIYTVTVSIGNCISQPSNAEDVVVTDQMAGISPTLSVSENVICEGQTLQLNSTAYSGLNVEYQWFFDNGNTTSLLTTTSFPTLFIPNFSAADQGIYSVVISNGACATQPSNAENVLLTNDLPGFVPTLSVSQNVLCDGETIQLNSSALANATYQWWFEGGNGAVSLGVSNVPTWFVSNVTSSNSGIYTVIVSLGACSSQPSNAQNVQVTQDLSSQPPTLNVAQNLLCEGETIELNSSPFNGGNVTYNWSFDDGNGAVLLASTNVPTFFISNATFSNSGVYTVSVSVGNCTTQPSNAQIVTVSNQITNQTPALSAADGSLCEGEVLVLNSTIFTGGNVTYNWFFDNGNGFVLVTTTTFPTLFLLNVSSASAGIYTVTVSVSNCTTPPSNGVSVSINNVLPQTPTLLLDDDKLCPGETLELNSSILPGVGVSYEWFFDDGTGNVSLGVTQVPTFFIPNVTSSNSGIYTVSASTGFCMSQPSNVQSVQVEATLVLAASNSTDAANPACQGSFAELSLPLLQGATYEWFGPHGFSANTHNPVVENIGLESAGDYFASIRTASGCTVSSQPTTVFVFENIVANADTFEIEINQTLTGAALAANDDLGNASEWSLEIITQPFQGEVKIEDGAAIYAPAQDFFGTDQFIYEICNLACPNQSAQATVLLNITGTPENKDCFVPNIITPNGDGANDFFKVPCLDYSFPNNNVKIFNRWGDLVHQAQPYKNDWNGTFRGNPLPPGTYFYLVQPDVVKHEILQGYFTITR